MKLKIPNISKLKLRKASLFVIFFIFILFAYYTWVNNADNDKIQNIAINQKNAEDSSEDFKIQIQKINVEAPVIRGVDPTDEKKYNESLKDGVAHMVGTALPGQGKGNIFIYGHSSADDGGSYAKIFAGLDNLKFGDEIKLYYNNNEYKYIVKEKKFIEKDDFSVLEQTEQEHLTLMTCWPIGTDDRRIIVVAKKK